MGVIVLVEWHVKPDQIEIVKELLRVTFAGTRQYEGCRRYEIYEDQESVGRLFLLTEWDSNEHYERYMAWRKETGILEQFGQTFAEAPRIHFLKTISETVSTPLSSSK